MTGLLCLAVNLSLPWIGFAVVLRFAPKAKR